MIEEESNRARRKHPEVIHNVMEGSGVIREEFEEFWEIVRRQHNERDKEEMLKELVQVAAMCLRTAEDCGLIEQPAKVRDFYTSERFAKSAAEYD